MNIIECVLIFMLAMIVGILKISIEFKFVWYDFWVGVYLDRENRDFYICPIPMFVFIIHVPEILK